MVFISRSLLILSDCGSRLLNNNFLYTKDQLYYQKILCCLKKEYRDIMKEIVEKTTAKKKKKKIQNVFWWTEKYILGRQEQEH